jgi:Fe2+ or Zn2+ uptake regulation protein
MSKKIAKTPKKVEIEEAEITPITSTTLVPKRKLLDFPVHKKNPFLDTTVIHSRNKRITVKAGSAIVDMGTGEIEGQTDIVQVLKVDDAKFIKVFTQNVGLYFELGLGGLRLLQLVYVLAQNRPGKDRIYMNPETMYDQLPANVPKLSLATFYRSLAELLNKDILARIESDIHWYFINPALFFNGDRIRFITQYERMTKDEQRAEQEAQLRIEQERKQKRLDFGD